MINRIDLQERVSAQLVKARVVSGLTQTGLAKKLGVGRSTIQNWESGLSAPDFSYILSWFDVCGQNPVHALISVLHPESQSMSAGDNLAFKKAMLARRLDALSDLELDQEYYLHYGDHGSSPYAYLQKVTADLRSPVGGRTTSGLVILNNFEDAEALGTLQEGPRVDKEALVMAINQGIDAHRSGKSGYVCIK